MSIGDRFLHFVVCLALLLWSLGRTPLALLFCFAALYHATRFACECFAWCERVMTERKSQAEDDSFAA